MLIQKSCNVYLKCVGCGGTLTSYSGSITSPNYPQEYGRNADCFWKITVSQGSVIQLVITDIDLEGHRTCNLDYIAVMYSCEYGLKYIFFL